MTTSSRSQQRTKQFYYLISQFKMNSLWDAMCGRPNGALAVCEKQNRLWQCILHKIILLRVLWINFPFLRPELGLSALQLLSQTLSLNTLASREYY